ncbi:ExeM/NucH family extracellular endonuclease [Georgenia sp. Z1491]|uniref:ExeM/NucH family extracellular endonuclease n=1 Tax=Georgenia sp. Z1491 TaxID=3416707 RepID=UPI003CEC426E
MTVRPITGRRGVGLGAVVALGLTSAVVPVAAAPAVAAPDDSDVIINEYYARGGSANAPYQQKFVELYNPTSEPIDLSGMSLQYRSATGTGATSGNAALEGTIEPGEYFVVSGGSNGSTGQDLSELSDLHVGGSLNPGGSNGVIVLVDGTDNVTLPQGSVATGDLDGAIVDLVGTGTATTFEGTGAAANQGGTTDPLSWQRDGHADTDDNAADFEMAAPTPEIEGGGTDPDPDPDPDPEPGEPLTIEQIQGIGDATPYDGDAVTTRGVVTAVYPAGGFDGFTIQTEGTGGDLSEHTASSGIFVYGPDVVGDVEIGDFVEVSGTAGEYFGLTQISGPTVTPLEEEFTDVEPVEIAWPETDAERELYESMLMLPTDEFTVTNTYWTLQYGEVGLATGDSPLITPTDVANPVTDPEGVAAVEADNAARGVVLNDGSSFNLINFDFDDHEIPLPYVTPDAPLRTGAAATFEAPVIVDFRRVQNGDSAWSFQPTTRASGENYTDWLEFENDRAEHAAPAEVGGNIQVASFNVLNYFSTLGEDEENCDFYPDREGNPTTADWCDVRGAWSSEAFARQEEKIVDAINTLDADVVALEEIENSAEFGQDRDAALATLTEALNEDAGAGTWGYVESPAELPADEDVIRTAFIYRVDTISPVGESLILTDSDAFGNAREPLAQEFAAVGADEELSETTFVVTANHFKSKGSGTDDGTGQGNANPDRIAQAEALVEWTEGNWGADQPVLQAGDFNAYSAEDPMQVFYDAGYTNLTEFDRSGAHSYNFDGMDGSLDHILANEAALELFTGSTIWEINANEPLALEYSRHNYNVTNFHEVSPFRSSDHNPGIVGLDIPLDAEPPADPGPLSLTVVNRQDGVVGSTGWLFESEDGASFYVADNNRSTGEDGVETLVDEDSAFGSIVVNGLPAGDYTVTNQSPGSSGYRAPEPISVTITGEEQSLEPFVMLGNGSTSVFAYDEDGELVPGVTYRFTSAEGETFEIADGSEQDTSDVEGRVSVGGLELVDWTIELVEVPDGFELDEEASLTVPLSPGTPHRMAGSFTLAAAPVVPGPVSFSVADSSGYTISNTVWQFTDAEGATFTVADNNARAADLEDIDDERSQVTVSGISAGEYTVENTSVASPWRAPEPFSVTVTGDEQDLGEFLMPGNGRIAVWVQDQDEEPIEGVTFRFTAADGTEIDVVDGSEEDLAPAVGTVRAGELELGTYQVSIVDAPGYAFDPEETLEVTIDSGTPNRFAGGFTLTQAVPGPVTIDVDDVDGQWVNFTTWQFTDVNDPESVFVVNDNNYYSQDIANLQDTDDEFGVTTFTGLPAGEYEVEALRVPDAWRAPEPFTIEVTGEEQAFEPWVLPGNGTVTAMARDEDGALLAGATFLFTAPDGTAIEVVDGGELDTNPNDGVVRLSELEFGTYSVQVVAAPEGYEFDAEDVREVTLTRSSYVGSIGRAFELTEAPVEPEPEPEPVPPTPGRGFYLNDGWDIWADHEFSFGRPGDDVLVGDWDGDGSDTLAVRRGNSYFLSNTLYGGNADVELTYGRASDTVLVGDWDGDGVDTLAVRRGNAYFVSNSLAGGNADTELTYGLSTDTVLVGDWDGNGTDTFGVRRGNAYFLANSLAGGNADVQLTYGRASDTVLVGDWDGNGVDSFAVRRGNQYLVSNSLTGGWADREVRYGRVSDEVFVGDWDGDGSDTLGVRR